MVWFYRKLREKDSIFNFLFRSSVSVLFHEMAKNRERYSECLNSLSFRLFYLYNGAGKKRNTYETQNIKTIS